MRYTRKYLIEMCEKALVPYDKWCDRDTYDAQVNVGALYMCLRAGCKYRISKKGVCATDDHTIWVDVQHLCGFKHKTVWVMHYLPTQKRLDDNKNLDWY